MSDGLVFIGVAALVSYIVGAVIVVGLLVFAFKKIKKFFKDHPDFWEGP